MRKQNGGVKNMVGNNFPKHKLIVPTLCARLYAQMCFRVVIPAWMPEFSFPRAAWERGVLEHSSALRGNAV